jgi:hypothetical protein
MIYAVGVDISIAFSKDMYYFRYKGIDFKYVPHYKNGETDDLICEIPKGSSQPDLYELITEFLSAFAFANNAKVLVHTGIVVENNVKLIDSKNRFVQKRSIQITEGMNEFYKISLLRTSDQIQLARLYREAFSSNNMYLKILFFWHCLVYPDLDESKAVKFINDCVGNLPKELAYMKDDINRFDANKVFLGNRNEKVGVGEYVKDSIRHSIAHIVRKPGYGVDLKLDSWEQIRHLHDIEFFMQVLAKYRLEKEYGMEASNDMKIFRYISENELARKG